MRILVIDIGGTHVKVIATGVVRRREFASGPEMTAAAMAEGVRKVAKNWRYDAVSIGYPGPVCAGRPLAEPHNLAPGWVGFDYGAAFERPIRLVNDAAMQALGAYDGGKMLFLGLGTGLGSTMIADGVMQPMELGHLPYKKRTYEDYAGLRGLERFGRKKWEHFIDDIVQRLQAALEPEYIVLGGGNARKLKAAPSGCRIGSNADAFRGGFRLWEEQVPRNAPYERRDRRLEHHEQSVTQ